MKEDIDSLAMRQENLTASYNNLMDSFYKLNNMLFPQLKENPWIKKLHKYHKAKSVPITEQKWYSDNHAVETCRHDKVNLRLFRYSNLTDDIPIVFVPPEAGHNSKIYDYGPGQSLVECAIRNTDLNIYGLEKLPATDDHINYSIEDSITSLKDCLDWIEGPVHLVGLCQGGWQAAMFAAIYPKKVRTLTLAAAPIDFHAGTSTMKDLIDKTPLSVYEQMVEAGSGNMPGAFILTGFKNLMAYERYIGDDIGLYMNVDDEKYVARREKFRQWYENTQPLPGKMFLEIVEKLFKKNQFFNEGIELFGKKVSALDVECMCHMIAGSKDHITPVEQLFALSNKVNNSEEIIVDAGHIGVFMGRKVIKNHWSEHFKTIEERGK